MNVLRNNIVAFASVCTASIPRTEARAYRLDAALLFCIAIAFALKLHALFVFEINWDEFLNLSWIYEYARGDLTAVLLTVYVHWFSWLGLVSPNEVDQIVAARLVMFALALATAWFIYRIACQYFSRTAALIAVLAYLSFTYVFSHQTSYRTDGMSTFLLMLALWLLVSARAGLWHLVVAGALIGLAGLVTVKSILYAPVFGAVLIGRVLLAPDPRAELLGAFTAVFAAFASFGAFYVIHGATLPAVDQFSPFVTRASNAIGEQGLFPQLYALKVSVLENIVFWLLLLAGTVTSVIKIVQTQGAERVRWFVVSSFAAILLTLLFYVNSYPYFYAFMLAPAVLLIAAAADQLPPARRLPILAIASAIFAGTILANYMSVLTQNNSGQRALIAEIHEMFPEPVPYLDRTSMVSRYKKVGFFMASWQMDEYHATREPVMRKTILDGQPQFLLANSPHLDLSRFSLGTAPPESGLYAADTDILLETFVPHWGPIYVAGKRFDLSRSAPAKNFEILIEGPYTLEGDGPVIIDEREVAPGSVVELEKGMHAVDLVEAEGEFVLRSGRGLYRPVTAPPPEPVFPRILTAWP